MNTQSISVSRLFSESWSLFKDNWKVVIPVTVITLVIQSFFNYFGVQTDPLSGAVTGGYWISNVIGMLVSVALSVGIISLFVSLARGESARITDMFTRFDVRTFFMLAIASILFGIIFAVGLVLLIVPGIIALLVFFPYQYSLVDKGLGPIAALKDAKMLTKGNRGTVFVFIVVMAIINLIGFLLFFVGLIITIPFTGLATALFYTQLNGEDMPAPEDSGDATAEDVIVEEVEDGDTTDKE